MCVYGEDLQDFRYYRSINFCYRFHQQVTDVFVIYLFLALHILETPVLLTQNEFINFFFSFIW